MFFNPALISVKSWNLCKSLFGNPVRLLNSKPHQSNEYDIVIVGGGMVGMATACAIGHSKHLTEKKVLLLDNSPLSSKNILVDVPPVHSARVCAISPGNAHFLEKLNAWQLIPRYSTVKKMQVWDACSNSTLTFEEDYMSENLCHIVENDMIVASLLHVLTKDLNKAIDIQNSIKVVSCSIPKNFALEDSRKTIPLAKLTLDDGTKIHTKLLIAADGANSLIAKTAGLDKISWNYDQSAVVASLKLQEPSENIVAWQRFLPTGPIALLPLDNETSSLVWSTSHQKAKALLEMTKEEFVSEINNAFWKETPQKDGMKSIEEMLNNAVNIFIPDSKTAVQYPPNIVSVVGCRYKFPLGCSHANEYVKPRVAFVGDAIHRIHPLAGQGVNLGFRDVISLVKTLEESVCKGYDIGSLERLLEYESDRQYQNLAFVGATNVLKYLFSTDNTSTVLARAIGVSICQANSSLKKMFMEQAIR